MTTFIYALLDPITDEVRYIGKANNPAKRFLRHISESIRKCKTHKECWIVGLYNQGLLPKLKILEEVSLDNWQNREKFHISQYKNLVNLTDGGDNPPNLKGKKLPEYHRLALLNSNLGKKRSEVTRRKLSESHKKKIVQYDLNGNMLKIWDSLSEASLATGGKVSNISACARKVNRVKTVKGYIWRFENESCFE